MRLRGIVGGDITPGEFSLACAGEADLDTGADIIEAALLTEGIGTANVLAQADQQGMIFVE